MKKRTKTMKNISSIKDKEYLRDKMKKYLWIGCCMDEELKTYYRNNGATFLSGVKSQNLIFEGLEKSGNFVFDSLNGNRVPFFPQFKSMYVKSHKWAHTEGAKDFSVGYLNLPYVSIFFKEKALKKQAKKYVKENKDNEINIFVYGLHSPFMKCACYIKEKCKSVVINQIIPDLPQYMDLSMSKIKKALKQIDWLKIKKCINKEDKFVLYASEMKNFLKLEEKACLLMEGLADVEECLVDSESFNSGEDCTDSKDGCVFMYSGYLEEKHGLIDFMDAFSKVEDKSIKLWISGSGVSEDKIKKYCQLDERIKFYGYIEDENEFKAIQKSADVLLSLRATNSETSSYCFPSKIFDYLLSGNIVVASKIKGIPEQYDDYLYYIEDITQESIKKIIDYVKSKSPKERALLAQRNIEFIKNNKTKEIQCERIWNFSKN